MWYISTLLTHWIGRSLEADDDRYNLLERIILPSRELLFSHNNIPFSSKYGGLKDKNTWGIKMVCFTDIPLASSEKHCAKYSRFGIAFHKHAMANSCVAPVAYIINPFIYEAYSYLYHQAVGLKGLVEGQLLSDGKHGGSSFSFQDFMQKLHHFIAWTQDYSEREFLHDERSLIPKVEMIDFFKKEGDFYYEREWRAIYREGDQFCWVSEHNGEQYFRFDPSSVRYIIVPGEYVRRANQEIPFLFPSNHKLEIVSFEDLASGNYDE